ncbi:GNAT family N-acetyltransferase [Winogradskyella helgolandensis]|uniref:GNAT family N-acetyltransferase n=1 Tax=Winogradskyella helgolandensis TaxID=2697010 RepID=UPI0015CD992E|nr:GNAT family N-acetyltransferase [Winogradskyella helgolandensis]
MKADLIYRKANLTDFNQLKSLGKASYSEFSKVLTLENWNKMNAFLESDEKLVNLIELSTVFVCEKEAVIIGMIYLVPSGNPTELFHEQWSYIRFLGVHTEFRGHGIGKKLTDLCIQFAKDTNETYMALHTSEFMDAARTIYEKRGFEKIKAIEYLGKRYWIYLYNIEA